MAFDYGAEVAAPITAYQLWPTEGEMVALVDGDMLPYIVGYTTEEVRSGSALRNAQFLYGKDPNPDDWAWIECLLKQPYFRDKIDHLNTTLNQWVIGAGADAAKIFMTDSASNFRLDVAFQKVYKGERVKSKPPFFYEYRHYLLKMHNAILAIGNEADDLMSITQWEDIDRVMSESQVFSWDIYRNAANTIIVTQDKDLAIVPGHHCLPKSQHQPEPKRFFTDELGYLEPVFKDAEVKKYEQWPLIKGKPVDPSTLSDYSECDRFSKGARKGQLKTKRQDCGYEVVEKLDKLKGAGLKFFYAQLIIGDKVDNYPGIAGKGNTDAYALLNEAGSESEMKRAVFQLYKEAYSGGTNDPIWVENYKGGTALVSPRQLMAEQGRLAWMQTKEGEVWASHVELPHIGSDVWQQR